MKLKFKTIPVAAALAATFNAHYALAQESNRLSPTAATVATVGAPTSTTATKKACDDLTIIAAMDITGSFADYLTKKEDLFRNSIEHMRKRFPRNLCID